MNRGDIHSQEKGSGARADEGKPHWGLMPLDQVAWLANQDLDESMADPRHHTSLFDLIGAIANFQIEGNMNSAQNLLRGSVRYLMTALDENMSNALVEVIRVWEHGEEKYAAFNWMKGMSWNSVIACYVRHLMKLENGITIDQESGRHHGAHLVCNAMMLYHYVEYYPQGNDLPVKWYEIGEDDAEPITDHRGSE